MLSNKDCTHLSQFIGMKRFEVPLGNVWCLFAFFFLCVAFSFRVGEGGPSDSSNVKHLLSSDLLLRDWSEVLKVMIERATWNIELAKPAQGHVGSNVQQ